MTQGRHSAAVIAALQGADWVFHLVSTILPSSANKRMSIDAQENVIKIKPPLCFSQENATFFLEMTRRVMREIESLGL